MAKAALVAAYLDRALAAVAYLDRTLEVECLDRHPEVGSSVDKTQVACLEQTLLALLVRTWAVASSGRTREQASSGRTVVEAFLEAKILEGAFLVVLLRPVAASLVVLLRTVAAACLVELLRAAAASLVQAQVAVSSEGIRW